MTSFFNKVFRSTLLAALVLFVVACGEGERKFVAVDQTEEEIDIVGIDSGAVKGPLINADVKIYKLELDDTEFARDTKAVQAIFQFLLLNGHSFSNSEISLASGVSEEQALDSFRNYFNSLSYHSELDKLKDRVAESNTLEQALLLISDFLNETGEVDCTLSLCETNEKVKESLKSGLDSYTNLNDIKRRIAKVESLNDELMQTESFSAARSLIKEYSNFESDSTKQIAFARALKNLDDLRSSALTLGAIKSNFELVAEHLSKLAEVQSEPNLVALSQLTQLRAALEDATTTEEAEQLLFDSYKKEGLDVVKQAYKFLHDSIITYEDFLELASIESALYRSQANSEIFDSSCSEFTVCIENLLIDIGSRKVSNFNSILISDTLSGIFPKNMLKFGFTTSSGVLDSLELDGYEGLIYVEVNALDSTVDLNTGAKPILDRFVSVFHTDDIKGYGDNAKDDLTRRFYKNGILQTDDAGNPLKKRSEFESLITDEVLKVNSAWFASPLSSLAYKLTVNKLQTNKNLEPDFNIGLPVSDVSLNFGTTLEGEIGSFASVAGGTAGNLISRFRVDQHSLGILNDLSEREVSSSLSVSNHGAKNILRANPLVAPYMKYEPEELELALAHRTSIEYFGGLLEDLSEVLSVSPETVLSELSLDLLDRAIDGKQNDTSLANLSKVEAIRTFATRDPSAINIQGIETKVDDISSLLNKEFKKLQPEENLADYLSFSSLTYHAPLGGVDSDNDGVLDKFDFDPLNPSVSSENQDLLAGVTLINKPIVTPFSGNKTMIIDTVSVAADDELNCEDESSKLACVFVFSDLADIDIQASLSDSVPGANVSLLVNADGDEKSIDFGANKAGFYEVELRISSGQQVFVDRYSFSVPDAAELQFRLVSQENGSAPEDNEAPSLASQPLVQVKSNQAICLAYDFCSEQDVGQYFDLSLLGEAFTVQWNIIDKDGQGTLDNLSSIAVDGALDSKTNVSVGDSVVAIVSFSTQGNRFQLSQDLVELERDVANVGPADLFPNYANCRSELDGVADVNGDGIVDNNDGSPCFKDVLEAAADNLVTLDVSSLGETWLYIPGFRFIIRRDSNQTEVFLGRVDLPKDEFGNYVTLESEYFVDQTKRNVYFAHSRGISVFSLGEDQLSTFVSTRENVQAITVIGKNVFVNYDGYALSYDESGQTQALKTDRKYPVPGATVPVYLGAALVKDSMPAAIVRATIDDRSGEENLRRELLLDNSNFVIPQSHTKFGDVIEFELQYTNSKGELSFITNKVAVLGVSGFEFTNRFTDPEDNIEVRILGAESSDPLINELVKVRWSKLNSAAGLYEHIYTNTSAPFILASNNFVLADGIQAEIVYEYGNQSLVLEQLRTDILGNVNSYLAFDQTTVTETIDQVNGELYASIDVPDIFKRFVAEGSLVPQWSVDDVDIEGENSFSFPSLSTTEVPFGSIVSVYLKFANSSISGISGRYSFNRIEVSVDNSVFDISPKLAGVEEAISLDFTGYTEESLNLFKPEWIKNGVVDETVTGFVYPASKTQYGDTIELSIVATFNDIDGNVPRFNHVAKSYVGLNIENIGNNPVNGALSRDDDGDGIPNSRDYFRYDANCSLESDGYPDDIDGDGLSDLAELSNSEPSNPNKRDTDGDGLGDFIESLGVFNFGTYAGTSDPSNADTDSDGFNDLTEVLLSLDPRTVNPALPDDLDFDGLSNDAEVSLSTRVNNLDTDSDGLPDGADSSPLNADRDNDGLADGVELLVLNTLPGEPDSDGDGVIDGVEVLILKTNPNTFDVFSAEDLATALPVGLVTRLGDLENVDLFNYPDRLAGQCFVSLLGGKGSNFRFSDIEQADGSSEQVLAWYLGEEDLLIRYDSQNERFLAPVVLGFGAEGLSSMAFSLSSNETLFVSARGEVSELALTGSSVSSRSQVPVSQNFQEIHHIFDLGSKLLLVGVDQSGDFLAGLSDGSASSSLDVQFREDNVDVYKVPSLNQLWAVLADNKLLKLSFSETAISSEVFESQDYQLGGKVYGDAEFIYDSNAVVFDLNSEEFFKSDLNRFNHGLFHLDQHLRVDGSGTIYDIYSGSPERSAVDIWTSSVQLGYQNIYGAIPSGYDAFVFGQKAGDENSPLVFSRVRLGDQDANSIPDWWQSVSGSSDVAVYNAYDLEQVSEILPSSSVVKHLAYINGADDFDGDGVSNDQELAFGSCNGLQATCSNAFDTDGDGLSDYYEINDYLDPSDPDNFDDIAALVTLADADQDGISDKDEILILGTDPLNADSDGDLLCDSHEVYYLKTDPNQSDSDGDQLSDGIELGVSSLSCNQLVTSQYSDPLLADTDSDGLSDFQEYNNQQPSNSLNRTDAFNRDSDGDGFTDAQEVSRALSGATYATDPNSFDTSLDSDSDGLLDSEELNLSFTSIDSNDSDGDGLTDFFEFMTLNSNPNEIDTDSDGICDYYDRSILTEDEQLAGFSVLSEEDYRALNLLISSIESGLLSADDLATAQAEVASYNNSVFSTSVSQTDSDLDGVSDSEELGIDVIGVPDCSSFPSIALNSMPILKDTDSDGLDDLVEKEFIYPLYDDLVLEQNPLVGLTLDAFSVDTDGDGLCDDYEVNVSSTNPAEMDTDFDLIPDITELNLSATNCELSRLGLALSNPLLIDSDGDNLTDYQEYFASPATNTNALDNDSDDDGIRDGDEDTDGDGFSDHVELNITGTPFNNADEDGDDIPDSLEDADGDNLTNAIELAIGTCMFFDPVSCPNPKDSDQDGLDDDVEFRNRIIVSANEAFPNDPLKGTQIVSELTELLPSDGSIIYLSDPLLRDTDGDGRSDSEELNRKKIEAYEKCLTSLFPAVISNDVEVNGDCPTNPRYVDSDFDGLSDDDENDEGTDPNDPDTDNDFLADGADSFPLDIDGDGDGLPDGIETVFLGSLYQDETTDGDDLLDGQEAWVYAYPIDPLGSFYQIGPFENIPLNSKNGDVAWSSYASVSLENVTDERVIKELYQIETDYDSGQITLVASGTVPTPKTGVDYPEPTPVASLYMQKFSDPVLTDTDGDGLSDDVELMYIEGRFGTNRMIRYEELEGIELETANLGCVNYGVDELFEIDEDTVLNTPDLGLFNPNESNSENFKVSNPYSIDTDGDGTRDGQEDADGDYLVNSADNLQEPQTVVISDYDDDCILDGIEVALIDTQIDQADSDDDGLLENQEVSELELEAPRIVEANELCLENEYRLSNIDGNDYCFSITFASKPNLDDSDGDGVVDVLPGFGLTSGDFFPMDATCSAQTDGVLNNALPSESYCYSSWIAEQGNVEQVAYGTWVNASSEQENYVALYGQGWDKVVHFMQDGNEESASYLPHIDVNGLVTIAVSESENQLLLAFDDNSISYFDTQTTARVDNFIQVAGASTVIDKIVTFGSHIIVQTQNSVTGEYAHSLYDSSGNLLDTSNSLAAVDLSDKTIICNDTNCSTTATLFGAGVLDGQANSVISSVLIDTVAGSIGSPQTATVFSDAGLNSGVPLALSADELEVYFSQGRKLSVDLSSDLADTTLVKSFGDLSFESYFNISELNQHFVAIVDEVRPSSSSIVRADKALFVDNNSESNASLRKYLIGFEDGEELLNVIPHKVVNTDDQAVDELMLLSLTPSALELMSIGIADLDEDGMPGIFETYYGLDDENANDKYEDLDGDGLTNFEEYTLFFDPSKADTNADGISDLDEANSAFLN